MPRVVFRLYAQLNDRLPPDRRQLPMGIDVPAGETVGEALRGLEIDLAAVSTVLVNGAPATLGRLLAEGDRVAAYPPLAQLAD